MKPWVASFSVVAFSSLVLSGDTGEVPLPKFRAVEIDSKIEIGYGVAVADVDGDTKPDILLADKKQIVWYRNPGWQKFIIAESLTKLDNVCIAAADIDGDGKAEIAVGAGWNPSDTIGSGAVFYLIPPKDRTQKWEAVQLPHEPTVHRMRWARQNSGKHQLIVVPLHGRGNKDGEGAGVKILAYEMPANPRDQWSKKVLNDAWHLTHNFELKKTSGSSGADDLLVASKEGVFELQNGSTQVKQLAGKQESGFQGAGEIRLGKLSGTFVTTVEPMHGNQVVVYTPASESKATGFWRRNVIDSSLKEGHALACGDLLDIGSDQIVAGWRGKDAQGKTGIRVFAAMDKEGKNWRATMLDDNGIACEDLCVADLNADDKLDIIASGRATKNVKVYFNERE